VIFLLEGVISSSLKEELSYWGVGEKEMLSAGAHYREKRCYFFRCNGRY
jgi:hypothetical protein